MKTCSVRSAAKPLAALCLLAGAAQAFAFERSDGVAVSCRVLTAAGPRDAIEEYVPAGTLGNFSAETKRLADGQWRIRIDERLIKFPFRLGADFLYYHECAHAQLQTSDELRANCGALKAMRAEGLLDSEKELALAQFHASLRNLHPKYGASGAEYWQATLRCAGDAEAAQK